MVRGFPCFKRQNGQGLLPVTNNRRLCGFASGSHNILQLRLDYQIELKESDRTKTAFIIRYGLFEHTRMGMGLCNTPATFQRAMQLVLRGLTWNQVLVYLDDVVIFGKDFDDCTHNLREALLRFRKYSMKLKPKKCELFSHEVEFFGKLVSADRIKFAVAKVEAVQQ